MSDGICAAQSASGVGRQDTRPAAAPQPGVVMSHVAHQETPRSPTRSTLLPSSALKSGPCVHSSGAPQPERVRNGKLVRESVSAGMPARPFMRGVSLLA